MLAFIYAKMTDQNFVALFLLFCAITATIITVGLPIFAGDNLEKRMKAVSSERDVIRRRERERLNSASKNINLRQAPKAYMKDVVEKFNLSNWLGASNSKNQLVGAGFRGQNAEVTFLFFRLLVPGICFLLAILYVASFGAEKSLLFKLGAVVGAVYVGIKIPEFYLREKKNARQLSIRRAWPDALDLLLICVESGMSIELAFKRVSHEVGTQSIPLAEELALTTAELSYLQERRQAYENLANRTDLDAVKAVCTALVQAERYGTPLGQALRVLAQESRDQRMNEAEKKAAALPPKLTVPMILFFLPVLFMVIMTPALINVFGWK
jgi:tight adherence protein C